MTHRAHLGWRGVLVVSAGTMAVGGAAVFLLSDVPFGRLFDAVAWLTWAGLVGTLTALAAMALRAGAVGWRLLGVLPALAGLGIAAVGVAVAVDYRMIPGLAYRHGLTAQEWTEDLRFLAERIATDHPRPFASITRQAFDERVAALEARIPGLDENRIKAELYAIAALPEDTHTYPNVFTHRLDWHMLPLQTWLFDDGLYVLDAGREDRSVIGSRIVAIEDTPVEDAYRILRPYLSAESEHNWMERFCFLVGVTEVLRAAGIVENEDRVAVTFESRDGVRSTRTLRPSHYMPVMYWTTMRAIDNEKPYVFWNDRRDNYWFAYQKPTGTLYVQFNRCLGESRRETVGEFVQRLRAWVEANEFERAVIDIRKNDGGDGSVSRAIADLVNGDPKLDRPGRLFVLTSRKTLSAAVIFLSLLESTTSAILVGEPTGQSAFFSGGPRQVALPNSGIEFNISQRYNRCALEDDGRDSIEPDVAVSYTTDDFASGRDPMMEAVLAYREPAPGEPGPELSQRLSGRYVYGPFQVLTISSQTDGTILEVSDFLGDSPRNLRSHLYQAEPGRFRTDLQGVELIVPAEDAGPFGSVALDWRGVERIAPRADPDHRVPMELLGMGRIREGVEQLLAQGAAAVAWIPDIEQRLNRMGYDLLRKGSHVDAIAVLGASTTLFPESANAHDSLGEAYMKSGRREQAVASYTRALQLNPASENARAMLKQLQGR